METHQVVEPDQDQDDCDYNLNTSTLSMQTKLNHIKTKPIVSI